MTDLRKQLNETNMKLDKILSIIAPKSKTSEEKSAPVAEKVASLSETVAKVVKKSTKKVASKKK